MKTRIASCTYCYWHCKGRKASYSGHTGCSGSLCLSLIAETQTLCKGTLHTTWPGGIMVRALDSRLKNVASSIPGLVLSGNNLGQVVHTHTRASVTKQYNLAPVKGR